MRIPSISPAQFAIGAGRAAAENDVLSGTIRSRNRAKLSAVRRPKFVAAICNADPLYRSAQVSPV
jgi:hypothetical protein